MSSSNPPCAGCKLLRRKCTPGCIFAPYFPAEQPNKFANVHRVFGASNVTKLLNDLPQEQREDAVRSLSYEAEARTQDPVYGCVGFISILQQRLFQLQRDLFLAKRELSAYISQSGLGAEFVPQNQFQPAMSAFAGPVAMGMGLGIVNPHFGPALYRDQQQQQLADAFVVAREQMLMNVEQEEIARMNAGVGFGQTGNGCELVGFGRGAVGDLSSMAHVSPEMHGHQIQQTHYWRRSNEERSCPGPSS
ncbi:hypothetical protein HPP92_019082 [Vanilla planifolia]|uniref:LOB domain-containing protein n=1 Tax=Vanilla planifolia TaxID=51239 RepID=A0A835UKM3_VANPL|nr:hypothetical protein HPP92_019082 [Vanilla planifolia]